eukprot:TRINITY_DN2184_c2_g3_i2.p1 TRINITY_DN2184_c2_g3~~TRINITY_DN2184_c2_g3_i2.p1  ORF type:complete len:836 (+),score=191.44 TRINITY_DN2184_c2_g3_i2:119-2626(+)
MAAECAGEHATQVREHLLLSASPSAVWPLLREFNFSCAQPAAPAAADDPGVESPTEAVPWWEDIRGMEGGSDSHTPPGPGCERVVTTRGGARLSLRLVTATEGSSATGAERPWVLTWDSGTADEETDCDACSRGRWRESLELRPAQEGGCLAEWTVSLPRDVSAHRTERVAESRRLALRRLAAVCNGEPPLLADSEPDAEAGGDGSDLGARQGSGPGGRRGSGLAGRRGWCHTEICGGMAVDVSFQSDIQQEAHINAVMQKAGTPPGSPAAQVTHSPCFVPHGARQGSVHRLGSTLSQRQSSPSGGSRPRPSAEPPHCPLFPGTPCAQGMGGWVAKANLLLEGHPVEAVLSYADVRELMQLFDATHAPPEGQGQGAQGAGAAPAAAGEGDSDSPVLFSIGEDGRVIAADPEPEPEAAEPDPAACPVIDVGPDLLPVTIVGDIHGQLADLLQCVLGPVLAGEAPPSRYLFLGDYVDRGPRGLDVFCLLALLRVCYPGMVTMLRGNHEDAQVSRVYGFWAECESKYPDQMPSADWDASDNSEQFVWLLANMSFPGMAVAAVVRHLPSGRSIFCCHGGLSPALVRQVDDSDEEPRPTEVICRSRRRKYGESRLRCCSDPWVPVEPLSPTTQGVLDGLLWSDPVDYQGGGDGDEGAYPLFLHSERGCGFGWTEAASTLFCKSHNFDFICRAHQMVLPGFLWQHSGRVLTLFSASNYCGVAGNNGAVLTVSGEWWLDGEQPGCRTYAPPALDVSPPRAAETAHAPPHYFNEGEGEAEDAAQQQDYGADGAAEGATGEAGADARAGDIAGLPIVEDDDRGGLPSMPSGGITAISEAEGAAE